MFFVHLWRDHLRAWMEGQRKGLAMAMDVRHCSIPFHLSVKHAPRSRDCAAANAWGEDVEKINMAAKPHILRAAYMSHGGEKLG